MFDNNLFNWKPENSHSWASRVSSHSSHTSSSQNTVNQVGKIILARPLAPFISEHEITLTAKYPSCAPLDSFGLDD